MTIRAICRSVFHSTTSFAPFSKRSLKSVSIPQTRSAHFSLARRQISKGGGSSGKKIASAVGTSIGLLGLGFACSKLSSSKEIEPEISPIALIAPPAMKLSSPSPASDDAHFLTPPLTGKYPVGVQSTYADQAGRILVDIHYPAVQTREARYKVHPLSPPRHPMNIDGIEDPALKERLKNLWTRSQPALTPATDGKFPVVIFSHGMGGNHFDNQNIVEELASQGYCVITISHPESNSVSKLSEISPPDPPPDVEQMVPALMTGTNEVELVIEQLRKGEIAGFLSANIDKDRIGVIGHSLGGDTALQACAQTSHIKAGIDLDAPILKGHDKNIVIHQPFLTLGTGKGVYHKETDAYTEWQEFHKRAPHSEIHILEDADHGDFGLDPAFTEKQSGTKNPDAAQVNTEVNRKILSFFNKHLKN